MAKRLRQEQKETNGKPAIDANEVNEAEVDPMNNPVYGRYAGRLLNPDEPYYSESGSFTDIPGTFSN